jgi:uncharacterized protein YdaU (DUF1376 family)
MTVPYMPLYIADYHADTSHLTAIEHGAYLLLIMCYWQRAAPLPADDKKLARICKVSGSQWARIKGTVLEFFDLQNGEAGKQLCHSKIDHELSKLRDKSLKKQKGGLARAQQMLSERSARGQLIIGVGEEVPLDKSNGCDDPAKAFWDSAKAYLGKSKSSLINKLCAEHGREAVTTALTTAMVASPQPPDRTAFVIGILKRQSAQAEPVIGI